MQLSLKNLYASLNTVETTTDYDAVRKALDDMGSEIEILKGQLNDQERSDVLERAKKTLLDLLSTFSFECDTMVINAEKGTITFTFVNTGLSYTTYATNFSHVGDLVTCTIFDDVGLVISTSRSGMCTCQSIERIKGGYFK